MWPARTFCAARDAFWEFLIINIYVAKCLEKRCRDIIESKVNDTHFGFVPAVVLQTKLSLPSKIYRNLGRMLKTSSHALSTGFLAKCLRKCFGVEYGADGCLLLPVKSLYSCSEVYVRVGRVQLRQFTVDVGLRQGCVLSPLVFILYIKGLQTTALRPNAAREDILSIMKIIQAYSIREKLVHSVECNITRNNHIYVRCPALKLLFNNLCGRRIKCLEIPVVHQRFSTFSLKGAKFRPTILLKGLTKIF